MDEFANAVLVNSHGRILRFDINPRNIDITSVIIDTLFLERKQK